MRATSRAIDPRRFSPKSIRYKVVQLQKLVQSLNALLLDMPDLPDHVERALQEASKEVKRLLSSDLRYDSPYLQKYGMRVFTRALADVKEELLYSIHKATYLSEEDLASILADPADVAFLKTEGGEEWRAVKIWGAFSKLETQYSDLVKWFDGLQEKFSIDSEEELFHASLYAADLAKNGWSSGPSTRTGLGALGKQTTVSFTYSLVYAQAIYQFYIAAWLVANKKMSVDRVAALFSIKRETIFKTDRKAYGIEKLDENGQLKKPQDIYNKNNQGLNEFLNFVKMYNVQVEFLAVFNQETLYKQLRSIPVTSIGIVKCVVNTDGAEHVPGEQELRVSSDAIKSTVLVTRGKY